MPRSLFILSSLLSFMAGQAVPAIEGFTSAFTPAEFSARRANVMEQIADGVAVSQGSAEPAGFRDFQQNAQFFYLTGVEVPRAVLIIDGKSRISTLFLAALPPSRNSRYALDEPVLHADDTASRTTGIENVLERGALMAVLADLGRQGRTFYAPMRPESRNAGTAELAKNFDRASQLDPLDGRPSREAVLAARLHALAGRPVQDLDPILDRLRLIKSESEIVVLREAARISQLGIIEVMRSARPGLYEYQLAAAAEYEFRYHDSTGGGYHPIVAAGTNGYWGHYHSGRTKLAASELVLIDYGPQLHYYLADLARMFPSSGTFTPRQREMYSNYLRLFRAVESAVRPGITAREVIRNATAKMERIVAELHFTDPKIEAAATSLIEHLRSAAFPGHGIGLEVHEPPVPAAPRDDLPLDTVLAPGMVLTVEPIMTIADERIVIRLEDELLITESGYENLSTLAPVEPDAIEKLMREPGLAERHGAGR